METPKIFESEYRFCLLVWEHEPIAGRELVALAREKLDWKQSTTYTVIRRLSDRGVLKNEHSVITSLVSKEQAQQAEIDELVEKRFEGNLPAFVAAFTRRERLSGDQVNQLQALIDAYRKGEG